MTTIGRERRSTNPVFILILFAIACGVIVCWMGLRPIEPFSPGPAVSELNNIRINQHAFDRHGEDAVRAIDWVVANAKSGHRYDCPDGRHKWFVPISHNEWAVVVIEAGELLTAFTTNDQGYVLNCKKNGNAFWNMAHP